MSAREDFLARGWATFDADPRLAGWLAAARGPALAAPDDPEFAGWHRHGRTWFVGVNALPNDAAGRVGDGPALACAALELATALYGPLPLDRAQVSIVSPGYPHQDPGESDAAHAFRRTRDAAHVDGLKPRGPARRRHAEEFHAYLLGLPVTDSTPAPLVVWEGSHRAMRAAFREALGGAHRIGDVDITDAYKSTRARIFRTCTRVELPVRAGQAVLVHRLALHGVAPWRGNATVPRAILYFRPALPGRGADWLALP